VALNRGVHEATGRWIVFLEHDLLSSPQLIERHVRAQERLGGEACIVGRVADHPKLKGGALTRFLMPQERYTLVENETLSFLDWRRANMSLSRKILLAHGGLDEKFSPGHFDDSDLGVRLAEHGIKAYFVDNAYAYAWRPESLITLRSRYYNIGYSLQRLVEKTQSREIYQRYDIAPSRLRHLGEVIAMPFYLRACRHPKDRALFFPRLYKRIFSNDIYTGYTDAQKNRPPRQHRR
jgi:glycosyltransferase involved in cell wall biosynthesis